MTTSSSDLSSTRRAKRPDWALDWMPNWMVTLRPIYQLCIAIIVYIFHLVVLTQHCIPLPFQLIPNSLGHFQMIPLDSLAGVLSLVGYMFVRNGMKKKEEKRPKKKKKIPIQSEHLRQQRKKRKYRYNNNNNNNANGSNNNSLVILPPLWNIFIGPTRNQAPWKFPKLRSMARFPGPRMTGALAMYLLVSAYFTTGQISAFWEDVLFGMVGMGFPMSIAMHRSLSVLFGHLSWIATGSIILSLVLRPQPFFGGGKRDDGTRRRYKWFTNSWDTCWLWWVLGGYFVSSWIFNLGDFINQLVLPHSLLVSPPEGVVSQLVNPEDNDWLASVVGAIAPCFTAPWWEEVLYRGFLLPALCQFMPYWLSVLLGGIIFSAHHVAATSAIPLLFFGLLWAILYTKSGNLLVTILVHSMWNSRVFLSNWFGL